MDVFGLTAAQFETYLLIFLRVSTLLFIFPVFSAPQIPIQVRIALSALISFMLFKSVPVIAVAPNVYSLILGVVSQVTVGMIVGFVSSLVFVGVQFVGELIDIQIGFAVANVINPTTQQNITVVGEFELAVATLLFLITDSHHLLIQGIAGSFNLVPLPFVTLDPSVMGNAANFLSLALTNVFEIGAPVAVTLFIVNVAFALMVRVAPQINVFVVGLPIQVGVGLIMLGITMPLMGNLLPGFFNETAAQMDAIMRGLKYP